MTRQTNVTKKADIILLLKKAASDYKKTLQEAVHTPLSEYKIQHIQQTIKSFIKEA